MAMSSRMSVRVSDQLLFIFGSKSLEYFDADSELDIIRGWYQMVKTPLNETTSMELLENEATDVTGKPDSRMYEYLQRAMTLNKRVPGLVQAECLVVLMYTDDNDIRAFFGEYNMASRNRNWQPYRIYTTLLTSALKKLAMTNPLTQGTCLYRGLSSRLDPPTASRVFWKAVTSTSLDFKTAERFAGPDGIILEFKTQAWSLAAQVGRLSKYEEEEVILLPFEAFDFLDADKREYHFKTSKPQELL